MEFTIYKANDEELIKGCLRRDRNAQKRLYDTYSPKMYALCCRYVRNEMEAEDVLLKAFTCILDKIDRYRGEGSLEGWIKRIVVNEALDCLRRRRTMFFGIGLEAIDQYDEYYNDGDPLEAEDLLAMIRELPQGYRTVFNLYAIDGYSHKEIAEQLHISENTSKSQLSKARNHLKKLLSLRDVTTNRKHHDITT